MFSIQRSRGVGLYLISINMYLVFGETSYHVHFDYIAHGGGMLE